jgi:O-antigen/teichoic acid export membrane protein
MVIPSAWLMYIVIQGGRFRPSRAGIITQLKFAIPLGLSSIAALVNRDLDKVLVSKFCDPELFAVYINGAMQIPMIGILTGSATAVLLPDMRRMVAAGQYGEALTLWKHAAVKCALILLPLMGFLMVMAPDLMTLMFGARYAQSATVFRIYLLLLPIRIAFFGTIFISSGRSNLILIRSIVMLGLNIVLSICLLKLIGYIGAAVATSLLIYIWAIPFNFFWISKIMRTGYGAIFPYLSILKILTAVILAGSALFIAKSFMGSQAVIRTGFCSILYAGLILLLFSSFKLVPLCRMAAIFGGKISNVWKK